jgi:hypothetical protein
MALFPASNKSRSRSLPNTHYACIHDRLCPGASLVTSCIHWLYQHRVYQQGATTPVITVRPSPSTRHLGHLEQGRAIAFLLPGSDHDVWHALSVHRLTRGPKVGARCQDACGDQHFHQPKGRNSFHSIRGFLCLPTIVTPRQCRAFASPARMMVASGSMGFSALTYAASLAACSMASISALQLA